MRPRLDLSLLAPRAKRTGLLGLPGLLAVGLALAVPAVAQPPVDEASVARRIPEERRCLEEARADLDQWLRLLAEAERQLQTARDPAMRAEAAHAVTVLEQRVRETADALLLCVPPVAAEPEPPPVEATPAPRLTSVSVHLRVGEAMPTGRGRLPHATVHRALLGFGRAVDACYEAHAERRAIVRAEATLALSVSADGHASGARVGGLGAFDATFQRCVDGAARAIRFDDRPAGGALELVVPLHLGPEG